MTNEEMKSALDAANLALVEKLGKQPFMAFDLTLGRSGRWTLSSAYIDWEMKQKVEVGWFDTAVEAFSAATRAIAKIPSENERNLREFQDMQAKLIDFGNATGIETKWLNPIVENARALAENAITHQAAE